MINRFRRRSLRSRIPAFYHTTRKTVFLIQKSDRRFWCPDIPVYKGLKGFLNDTLYWEHRKMLRRIGRRLP